MKRYWIHKTKDGELELQSFDAEPEADKRMFRESAEDAIKTYQDYLQTMLEYHKKAVEEIGADTIKLDALIATYAMAELCIPR